MRGLLGPTLLALLAVFGAGCSTLRAWTSPSRGASQADARGSADAGTSGAVSGPSPELLRAIEAARLAAENGAAAEGSDELGAGEDELVDDGGGEGTSESASAEGGEDDAEGDDEAADVEEEGESHEVAAEPAREGMRYTADLSDAKLEELWRTSPESLGTLSLGFVDEGRLINSEPFPPNGDGWVVVSPHKAYATQETIDYLLRVIHEVHTRYPTSAPLRVNQLSGKDGGYLRPHKSHQNGRDVDLGFYYRGDKVVRVRAREKHMDPARNWALVKALVTLTDVQFILVDSRVQKVLYAHALRAGENKAWLDSLFKGGKKALIRHARRHRDHFHVRFYNARAQELGRRVTPLLALRPEQNVTTHRVRRGDTLGSIARRYGSSVLAIKKANRLKSAFLKTSRVLKIPLKGPCTRCPVPPAVVLPERRLPPGLSLPPELLARPMPRPPLATLAALAAREAEARSTPITLAAPEPSGAGAGAGSERPAGGAAMSGAASPPDAAGGGAREGEGPALTTAPAQAPTPAGGATVLATSPPPSSAAGGSAPARLEPAVLPASGTVTSAAPTPPVALASARQSESVATDATTGARPEPVGPPVVHPGLDALSQDGTEHAPAPWRSRLHTREFVLPRMLKAGSLLRQVYGVPE